MEVDQDLTRCDFAPSSNANFLPQCRVRQGRQRAIRVQEAPPAATLRSSRRGTCVQQGDVRAAGGRACSCGPRGTSCCHDMNMLTHLLASLINSVEVISKASMCVSMQSVQQGGVHSTWLPVTPGMHVLLCLSLTWIILSRSIYRCRHSSLLRRYKVPHLIHPGSGEGEREEGVRLDFEAIPRRLP